VGAWFQIPSVLGMIEDLLDLVHEHGLDKFAAVAAVNAVFMYVLCEPRPRGTFVMPSGPACDHLAEAERDLQCLRSLARYCTTVQFDARSIADARALMLEPLLRPLAP
jgi:hypothetical protein